MMRTTAVAGMMCLTLGVGLIAGETASETMFTRLRGLTGEWEGTYEWSGGRTDKGPLKATYYLTGNGSALVENLILGGEPSMTTVYHLDGSDLRMTHFCGARNQPRLKASRVDDAQNVVQFSFVDVTNVGPANPGYVQGLEVRLHDADHIGLTFNFGGGVKEAVENIDLHRIGTIK